MITATHCRRAAGRALAAAAAIPGVVRQRSGSATRSRRRARRRFGPQGGPRRAASSAPGRAPWARRSRANACPARLSLATARCTSTPRLRLGLRARPARARRFSSGSGGGENRRKRCRSAPAMAPLPRRARTRRSPPQTVPDAAAEISPEDQPPKRPAQLIERRDGRAGRARRRSGLSAAAPTARDTLTLSPQ